MISFQQYSPHSVDFSKSSDSPIFHDRGQPLSVAALSWQSAQRRDQLNCPLIWRTQKHILITQYTVYFLFMKNNSLALNQKQYRQMIYCLCVTDYNSFFDIHDKDSFII